MQSPLGITQSFNYNEKVNRQTGWAAIGQAERQVETETLLDGPLDR